MIIALAGRRIDATGATTPRFPAQEEGRVKEALRALFANRRPRVLVSSAACGADIVALEVAAATDLRCRIVLPFDRAKFRQTSVVDRGAAWGERFDRLVDRAQAAGDLITLTGVDDGDPAYGAASRAILDEATTLAARAGIPASAIVVWDGLSRGADDVTAGFWKDATARGLPVTEVLSVPTCFVVQGFGEKSDLSTGRVLNLDASYEVIKEAVEEAGVRCIRADEVIHSQMIDIPMYEWLYKADLVIADLSTYNVNAAYELGVRYGVRPQTTLIVAEDQFKNPFDVGHIVTLSYTHLGKDVGRREATRFKKALGDRVRDLLRARTVDSPVYSLLRLRPPVDLPSGPDGEAAAPAAPSPAAPSPKPDDAIEESAKELIALAQAAIARDDFTTAKGLFQLAKQMRPRDEYVLQQLALATYKAKSPDALTALREAQAILQELRPDVTNDPETLGLWGAVHKRLWDLRKERADLDTAIASYERGFYLKQDYYNGINLAFLLNVRSTVHEQAGDKAEAVTDFVLARRVRREVLRLADKALATVPDALAERYWVIASLWEAAVGLEDDTEAARCEKDAKALADAISLPTWMLGTTQDQLARLRELLAKRPTSWPS